jgi:hypothetical protein
MGAPPAMLRTRRFPPGFKPIYRPIDKNLVKRNLINTGLALLIMGSICFLANRFEKYLPDPDTIPYNWRENKNIYK